MIFDANSHSTTLRQSMSFNQVITRLTTTVFLSPLLSRCNLELFQAKARIEWPRGNQSSTWTNLDQELSTTLTVRLKGYTVKQLSLFCEIAYDMCLERFGEEEGRTKSEFIQQPNRRQVMKGQLRTRQRQLKRQLNEAPDHERPGIQALLDDIKQQILVLHSAENHRKCQKKKRRARESFYRNPYAFAKEDPFTQWKTLPLPF